MIILGIDPGLVKTGYGLIQVENNNYRILDFGIISPNNKEKLSFRLRTIYNDVSVIIDQFNPNILSIEEVFFGKNVKSALLLGHARGVAMLSASNNNIPVFEYSAKKVKQAVTGNGNADKTQLQYMIKQIFKLKQLPAPLDASDAIGIALCHIYQTKIKSLNIGLGVFAPVSLLPRLFGSSMPTYTPITYFESYTINHVSVFLFVVPVFPANGKFRFLSFLPVPLLITPCIIDVI